MRLSPTEESAIAAAALAVLPPGSRVMLFVSRTDDKQRGGDIDLLIEPPEPLNAQQTVDMSTELAARLYRSIGERGIGLLVAAVGVSDERPIVAPARRHAVGLMRTGAKWSSTPALSRARRRVTATAPR